MAPPPSSTQQQSLPASSSPTVPISGPGTVLILNDDTNNVINNEESIIAHNPSPNADILANKYTNLPLNVNNNGPRGAGLAQPQIQSLLSQPEKSSTGPGLSLTTSGTIESTLVKSTIPEMLVSIDDKLSKLQENFYYYRTIGNYGLGLATYPSYFNLIKSQYLTLENLFENKLSNVEHKFANIEIEDGIWKKTINWKIEELSSKVSY